MVFQPLMPPILMITCAPEKCRKPGVKPWVQNINAPAPDRTRLLPADGTVQSSAAPSLLRESLQTVALQPAHTLSTSADRYTASAPGCAAQATQPGDTHQTQTRAENPSSRYLLSSNHFPATCSAAG